MGWTLVGITPGLPEIFPTFGLMKRPSLVFLAWYPASTALAICLLMLLVVECIEVLSFLIISIFLSLLISARLLAIKWL